MGRHGRPAELVSDAGFCLLEPVFFAVLRRKCPDVQAISTMEALCNPDRDARKDPALTIR
jgi:hypothetical protein